VSYCQTGCDWTTNSPDDSPGATPRTPVFGEFREPLSISGLLTDPLTAVLIFPNEINRVREASAMSSTKLLSVTPAPRLRSRRRPERKRPFDLRAKADLRNLLAALREIGDRPDVDQLLLRYDVSETQLKTFIKAIEADAVVTESSLSFRL
jgi:hypothetical protein